MSQTDAGPSRSPKRAALTERDAGARDPAALVPPAGGLDAASRVLAFSEAGPKRRRYSADGEDTYTYHSVPLNTWSTPRRTHKTSV